VPLGRFSVEGLKSRNLRYTLQHLRREGCRFKIVAVEHVPSTLDTLAATSAEWLASKNVREKGFSLGRFERDM
jgi:phosphatidylglycerol lysyltransferase